MKKNIITIIAAVIAVVAVRNANAYNYGAFYNPAPQINVNKVTNVTNVTNICNQNYGTTYLPQFNGYGNRPNININVNVQKNTVNQNTVQNNCNRRQNRFRNLWRRRWNPRKEETAFRKKIRAIREYRENRTYGNDFRQRRRFGGTYNW